MLDPQYQADTIRSWENLGLKLPKALSSAIALYDAVASVRVAQPVFDFDSLTVENAQQRIEELAAEVALVAPVQGRGGSVLGDAKGVVAGQAANRLLAQARSAAPALADQLAKPFAEAAEAYCASVPLIPADLSSDSLVAAGSAAVAGYEAARGAAGFLAVVDAWLASVAGLMIGGPPEQVIRCVRPATLGELATLDQVVVNNVNSRNTTLRALNPVWFAAAREGIEFDIVLPGEAVSIRRALSSRTLVH